MPRPARQPDFTRQTAILFRWLVWGAIFAMLGVLIYQTVSKEKADGPLLAMISAPLPEAERPKLAIDREKLEVVEDGTRFRSEEEDVWFHLLDVLRSTPDETLRRASLGLVTWIQLFNQPEVYRGEPVTLVGHVQRATRLGTPKNELSFIKYYQLWLQPSDNLEREIVVYCLELPKGFPVGLTMDEPVVLTGLFFKRWLYLGKEDLQSTPVVLARSLEWKPRPKATEMPMSRRTVVMIIVAGLLLSVVFVTFWHLRTRRPSRSNLPEEIIISEKMYDVKPIDDEE